MASAVNETYLTASGVILQREVGLKACTPSSTVLYT
jgi:hypothetical protein